MRRRGVRRVSERRRATASPRPMIGPPPMDRLKPPPHPWRRLRATASLLAIVALSGVLTGCGGGTGTGTGTSTSSPSVSSTSTTSTPGQTTTAVTSTVTLPGTGRPTVTIGDKNYAEQFVLGQLYQQALVAQGFKVNITQNIGPTSVVRNSLKSHTLAMYPEYLDVVDETLAHDRRHFATLAAADSAGERWAERHGLELLDPTPFSDTAGIAVTDMYAAAHHLRTLGDLLDIDDTLVIGGAVQFKTDRSGLRALSAGYGVVPESFVPLAVGDQYTALDLKTVQAAYVNTLATGDYRVLGDPQKIFGFGNIVPVITQQAVAEEGPAFAATIERVDRTLTLATMRELNNAVSVANLSPVTVALQYLETRGLLAPLSPSDY
jgi:osmoprotectant transport system substrate-binding protein